MKIIVRFFTRMKLFFTTIVRTRKEIMSDNVSHINKLTKELEQLLNEKQSQYGSFDNTSYAMKGILESILTDDVNGYNELNRKMKIREAENE
jgi:REP element-mobilizing transposase RayT